VSGVTCGIARRRRRADTGGMRKWATLALGFVVAVGLAFPARAAAPQQRYVAQGDNFVLLAFMSSWTGIPVRGLVSFVPTADHATVTIHDALATGSVRVVISSADGVRYV